MMAQGPRTIRRLGVRAAKAGIRVGSAAGGRLSRRLPEPLKIAAAGAYGRLPAPVRATLRRPVAMARHATVSPTLYARASQRPEPPDTPVRVWIAPANFAGQGRAWAAALESHVEGVGARNMAVRGVLRFPTDQEVAPEIFRYQRWQREQEAYLLAGYTHVLVESERPVLGGRYGRVVDPEVEAFRRAGLSVALICHGSDVRDPRRHARTFPHSPFADAEDRTTKILQARAEVNGRYVNAFEGHVFVSTPDLVDDVPEAIWCPAVVDMTRWQADWPVFARRVPRVVHVPSNGRLKGSEFIDPVLAEFAAQGRIEYRSLRGLSSEELLAEYSEADIVVDQVVMGLYGVASVEAMAAGRVVVGFVGDTVRRRIRDAVGLEVPIVEATPETLREVVEGLLADPEGARRTAAAGPGYVEAVHDGRYAAEVLTRFTGGTLRPRPARAPLPPRPRVDLDAPVRLLVGPANFASQGRAWAAAARAHLPGVDARSMSFSSTHHVAGPDYEVPEAVITTGEWTGAQERYLAEFYTHVLAESLRPVTGHRYGRRGDGEWAALRGAGLSVALIAHGSDVRDPRDHLERTPWSPFGRMSPDEVAVLDGNAQRRRDQFAGFDGPTFVSTPDLLDDVPAATWCPVVVDLGRWRTEAPLLPDGRRPIVAHVPSSARLKGTELVDPVVRALQDAEAVTYLRAEGVPADDMPGLFASCDIVLDQFALGSYGVAACEAMAAGRVVVGHVTDVVRARVLDATGLHLPVVEATPDTLAEVLRGLVATPDATREIAARGVEFVTAVHDGRRSAQALGSWLRPDPA